MLKSFHPAPNVAVIGASGSIGRAIVERLAASGQAASVHALSRTPVEWVNDSITSHYVDLQAEESIRDAALAVSRHGPLDMVVVTTGILHRDSAIKPEKSFRDLNADSMMEVLAINTIGPTLVGKHFLPAMRRDHKTVFAALSARVGSIGDNRLGGWLSYRMSKSALNMAVRTLAIEQRRKLPDSIVVTLHPGTVDTALSKPFTSRVPSDRLFEPARAASQLLDVIAGLGPDDTGGFFAWDGAPIQF